MKMRATAGGGLLVGFAVGAGDGDGAGGFLALSSDTAVAGDTDSLADPVGRLGEVLLVGAPCVVFLPLIRRGEVLGCRQTGHQHPFCDRRTVNPG